MKHLKLERGIGAFLFGIIIFYIFLYKSMANTGTGDISYGVNNYYNRVMLERGRPMIVHNMFAQIRDIPLYNGSTAKFRRYGALATNTTALVEGVTPLGKQLSATDITANVYQYGDFITLTDWIQMTTLDPILTEAATVLGEQAGDSIDEIIRDVLTAGTNIQYAGGVASRNLVAIGNKLTGAEVKLAVRALKRSNAKRITSMVDPDEGYNTSPVDAAYIGLVGPDTTFDLQSDALFVSVEKYARQGMTMPGEVGKLSEVRFIETSKSKKFVGAGSGGIDVSATMILGMDAYGVTRISGNAMVNIVKALGSAGAADPLNQRSTSGWKATLGVVRINESFMIRIEHATTA